MCEAKQSAPEATGVRKSQVPRSDDYEFVVSVLAEVLPSDDDSSFENAEAAEAAAVKRRAPTRRSPRRTPRHSGVPLEVVVVSDNDSSCQSFDVDDDEDRMQTSMSRDELNLLEDTEDPLPDFQNTVDALGQLSFSESTCSLARSRAGACGFPSPSSPRRSFSTLSPTVRRRESVAFRPRSRSMCEIPPMAPMLVRENRVRVPTASDPEIRSTTNGSSVADQSPRKPRRSSLCIMNT